MLVTKCNEANIMPPRVRIFRTEDLHNAPEGMYICGEMPQEEDFRMIVIRKTVGDRINDRIVIEDKTVLLAYYPSLGLLTPGTPIDGAKWTFLPDEKLNFCVDTGNGITL